MPADLEKFGTNTKQRNLILVIAISGTLLAGVVFALLIDRNRLSSFESEPIEGKPTIISDIIIGALAQPQAAKQPNPPIRQKPVYGQFEPLVIRITTAPEIEEPIQLGARLVRANGTFLELNPPSLEFQPGTSCFCCWTVGEIGTFELQLFRPEKTVTSIPLTIIRQPSASEQPKINIF